MTTVISKCFAGTLCLFAFLVIAGAQPKDTRIQTRQQGEQVLDKALDQLRRGHDLRNVDGWKARANTTVDNQTYSTNFNSSCASLIYGYRDSKEHFVESNTNALPEFPPHLVPVVLEAERRDPASVISRRGNEATNARMFDVIEITPAQHAPAYASKQVWYVDEITGLPAQINFVTGNEVAKLYLDDYRITQSGILVPFGGKYISSDGKQTDFHYTEVVLEHGEHCPH